MILTVRFLVTGTGTTATELFRLCAAVISDEQCAVVLDESLFQLVLGVLVNIFLVVGDDGLGNSLANSIDLGSVTTTSDTDADINTGEFIGANNQKRLVNLFDV